MKAIARDNKLPGFDLALEIGKSEPLLRMTRHDPLPTSAGERRPAPARPTQSALSPAAPVAALPAAASLPRVVPRTLSPGMLERIRRDFPGWDLQELKNEFDAWVAGSADRVPANYEAAFYGFVRSQHTRRV